MPKLASSSDSSARITVPADAVIDSPTRTSASLDRFVGAGAAADLLAHAEHEEQAVVGPGPEHEDDQQQLGDLRDLQPVGAELADQPRRDGQRRARPAAA